MRRPHSLPIPPTVQLAKWCVLAAFFIPFPGRAEASQPILHTNSTPLTIPGSFDEDGEVKEITYNVSTGYAEKFKFEFNGGSSTKWIEFETPSEKMTDNLQRWKDNQTTVHVFDADEDCVLEESDGDEITEA